jgi:hypothetical protein
MNHYIGYSGHIRFAGQSNEMLAVAVYAAIGDQSKEMQAVTPSALESLSHDWIATEFAFRDRLIDAGKILINDSSGAEIKMSDL